MRRIAMIGFALATVSVLLAGCAAGSSQEPLYTTVDTPYYDVMLPTSLFSSFAVDYDDSYRLDGDTGEGIGFCVSVCDEGSGEPLWYVLCATSSYGGQRRSFCMARSARVRVAADLPIRRSRPRSRLRPLRRREVVALPRMFHVKHPFVCAACCRIGLPIGECRAVFRPDSSAARSAKKAFRIRLFCKPRGANLRSGERLCGLLYWPHGRSQRNHSKQAPARRRASRIRRGSCAR